MYLDILSKNDSFTIVLNIIMSIIKLQSVQIGIIGSIIQSWLIMKKLCWIYYPTINIIKIVRLWINIVNYIISDKKNLLSFKKYQLIV